MRTLLAIALALLLGLPFNAAGIKGPSGFEGTVSNATFALYWHGIVGPSLMDILTGNAQTHEIDWFTCTATAYEKTPDGYNLLSAGHCVDGAPEGAIWSVSPEIGGPRMAVTVVKSEFDEKFDFAVFHLKTNLKYPVIPFGTEDDTRMGDKITVVHFADGLTKQLSRGIVSSGIIGPNESCKACLGDYIAQIFAGSGASGSAVVSMRTRRIIGMVQGSPADGDMIGFFIEPASHFPAFLAAVSPPTPVN